MTNFENTEDDEDWNLRLSSDNDDDSSDGHASPPNTSISIAGTNAIKLFLPT